MLRARPVLRAHRPGDTAAVVALFRAAVHETAASHYDTAQRNAWAPVDLQAADWETRLADQHVLLAECDGELAGFIAWDDDGLVDLLFTAPTFGRRGIATALYLEAETRMRAAGLREASTFASHVSRPVFERQGWRVVHAQTVQLDGVGLERFRMCKALPPASD
ncbi:GNAT family N-acetyltransferase [Arenimonas daejeonensis]|uniref:GNAT family N-acetyltransferase n=1 Tax=Arenimonas daejeonensis TaxID=370777 RepID=UPI0011BDC041|nr:GNAT family N-acetyltransferase [Arenimonas daejeonensis]